MKRIEPQAGQESVWDYPRPPLLERVTHSISVHQKGVLAQSTSAFRILETSHPPTYYLPWGDVASDRLLKVQEKRSYCEWKGMAIYWALVEYPTMAIAWSYPNPEKKYAVIKDHLSFYASKVEACYVGDERVLAQDGDFYGGWITKNIVGPFKGGKGTWGW